MSNIVAGDIFLKIIEAVVSDSQTDFEENGVNQQTLAELQQTWQAKLSSRSVAQLPWDPKPAPPPQVPQSNSSSQNGTPLQPYAQVPNQTQFNGSQRIKQEPGTESGYPVSVPNGYPQQGLNPALAHQRAVDHVQKQFGAQANASLGNMQRQNIALPGQQRPQGLQLPGQNQHMQHQMYTQQLKQQQASQQPRVKIENQSPHMDNSHFPQQPQQRPDVSYAQTDGAGEGLNEWNGYMAQRRAFAASDIAKNDHMMRDHVAELAASLDSGLMLPLGQQKRRPSARRRTPSRPVALSCIPQLDGELGSEEDEKPDVRDEEDEDAINSALDSSDDEAAKADEDDEEIDSMLCTYDKVQRVKNKWKCTLKDGVLLANGKEYLFHKAQGEFEW